ncbi:hypothetical protein D3C81_2199410 [compost metagenome]
MLAVQGAGDTAFYRLIMGIDLGDIVGEGGQVETAGQIGDGAAAVAGQDVEDIAHGWREAADDQVAIQE